MMTDRELKKNGKPLVSICLLSYNDEAYVEQAIQDLLAQDYENIELIISDDCSSDKSATIIRQLAKKDGRIQFFPQSSTLGMQGNYNFVLSKASGEFFMWASSDDRWDIKCVSSLVRVMESRDSLVSVGVPYQFIDENGDPVFNVLSDVSLRNFEGANSITRLAKFSYNYIDDFFYGLHRKRLSAGLKVPTWWLFNANIPANCPYPVLAFLLSCGEYARLDGEAMLYKRIHRSSPPRHSAIYRGRPLLNILATILRKINVLYETLKSIYKGSGSFFVTALVAPLFLMRCIYDCTKYLISIFRGLLSKAISLMRQLHFLIRNARFASGITKFSEFNDGDYVFRGMRNADISEVKKIVDKLNNGIGFDWSRRLLYRLIGSRALVVAESINDGDIVGVDVFYFNPRDRAENTIHEGFIGVLPSHQGKGLASKLRKHAIEGLQRSKLSGISTRISVSNAPSLSSAEKMGFRVIERYFDKNMGEDRCYLIRYF